jgi:replicative superfamily II helicase
MNNWKTIFLFMIAGLLIYEVYNNVQQDDYRKSFKGETIALVTINEGSREDKVLRYYFYTDRKILGKIGNRSRHSNLYKEINKFYKVKYDLNKPEENEIFLEEEVKPDSLSLVKAGFTKTKYYEYDNGVTGKYLEKSRWK